MDIDVFQEYLVRNSPLLTGMDGRLAVLNDQPRRARIAARRGRHAREPLFYWKN